MLPILGKGLHVYVFLMTSNQCWMNWKMTNSQWWMNCDSNLLLILEYVMTFIWVCNHLSRLKRIECLHVKSSWTKDPYLKWTQENASTFPHEMEVCGNWRRVVPKLPSSTPTLGVESPKMCSIFGSRVKGPNLAQIEILKNNYTSLDE